MVGLSLNWVGSVSFWICLVYGIETCLHPMLFAACLFIVWSCFNGSDYSGSDYNFGGSVPHVFVGELCESSPAETRLTVYRRPQHNTESVVVGRSIPAQDQSTFQGDCEEP